MGKLIAIDNGHGINTAGKRTPKFPDGSFMHEYEFNSAVAKYLEPLLKQAGFQTLMISPTSDDKPLGERTKLANSKKADFFLSIHANASTGVWGNAKGVETYTYKTSNPDPKTVECGNIINQSLVKASGLINRGLKTADFQVLRETQMPAALVECGFMDNMDEAKLLLSDAYRRKIAAGLAEAIRALKL